MHMPRASSREALLEQRRQIDERLKRLDAREKELARKADARRKIIAGALALEHAERNEAFGEELRGLLDRYVERPADRALFGLGAKEPESSEE